MASTTDKADTSGKTDKSSQAKSAMDLFNSPSFDTQVHNLISEWHVPGFSAALVHDQTFTSKAWGYASIDPPKPCTPDTLFDIASASKSTTAGAVALLIEDENFPNVQWDAKMSSLLPDDFVMSKEEYTRDVTVEDILSHRSGLPSHDDSYFGPNSAYPDTPQSVTRNLRNLPVSAPIRTKEQYCNLMFTVASYLVEKISDMTFGQFLHEKIWTPLGMDSTSLQPKEAKDRGLGDRLAIPQAWDEEKQSYKALEFEQTPESQGAGSVITSVNDYIKWVQAVMNHDDLVTDEMYKGLTKPRIFSNPDDDIDELDPFSSWQAYAAGWEIYFYRGHKIVRHDGLISGFSSIHFFLPEYKFGGAMFGNSGDAGTVGELLMKELIDEMLEVPKNERPDWNALAHKRDEEQEQKEKEEHEQLRKDMCPNGEESQKIPLSVYTGEYYNAGYKGMTVSIKDDHLHVDASDRTMGFYLDFEHICGQTMYIANITDALNGDGDVDKFKAEFRFDNDRVVKMGLHLEAGMDELLWFDRVDDQSSNGPQQEQPKLTVR